MFIINLKSLMYLFDNNNKHLLLRENVNITEDCTHPVIQFDKHQDGEFNIKKIISIVILLYLTLFIIFK